MLDLKGLSTIEAAISDDDVAVGVEAEKVAEGLNGAGTTMDEAIRPAHVRFHGLPGEAGQIGKEGAVIQKVVA